MTTPPKNRPQGTAILLYCSVAALLGSGLTLFLEIANRASGWLIAATVVGVFFMFGFTHLAREIHLDGRLPRIGDWKSGENVHANQFYDPADDE